MRIQKQFIEKTDGGDAHQGPNANNSQAGETHSQAVIDNGPSRQIDGLKLTKPKPKYDWSVKQNHNNNDKPNKSEEEFTVKLKNHFTILQDDNDVTISKDKGASSSDDNGCGDNDKLISTSLETDSEVEDLGNEFKAENANKGASTPSEIVSNV
nr:hypothetical protein [Tanacetum cinerariifolium]